MGTLEKALTAAEQRDAKRQRLPEQEGLVDPGSAFYESGSQGSMRQLRPEVSGSAGGSLIVGPGGVPVRIPPARPATSQPSGAEQPAVRPQTVPAGSIAGPSRIVAGGVPFPPTMQAEALLQLSLWVRNYVRQHQGEEEAARQFGYLDPVLQGFIQAGLRVDTQVQVPRARGQTRSQDSEPQSKGKGPAEQQR